MANWRTKTLSTDDWKSFDKAKIDPMIAVREKVSKNIDETIAAVEKGDAPRGMKIKEAADGSGKAIGLKIKAGSKRVSIDGHDEIPVPIGAAVEVLRAIKEEVGAGKHDSAITKALGGVKSGSTGRGWSPERRAKYQETIAKRG